ncbi:MAG: TetR/AcrR family transcriptional regulator [Sphingobium sp.]|jgi:TetR/AcrR family transcriptional repressor for divergent bdcA|nr:MAG: TetR/AcrR family transcriptional regulator [Sphingobium sp.]
MKARGRPRAFDVEAALDTAQALFHERGYGALGVAALTDALGIKPPSFYAAFGSKAALFEQVMTRYTRNALPVDAILRPGRDPAEALGELLEAAARVYVADPHALGCLVIEAARSNDDADVTAAARSIKAAARAHVRDYVAASRPDAADLAADHFSVATSGLSAAAREGWPEERLLAVARMSLPALRAILG